MAERVEMEAKPQSNALRYAMPQQEFSSLENGRHLAAVVPRDVVSTIESSLNIPIGQAIIYCRVSTNFLAKGTSLESQRAACVAHALKLGYKVARVTEEVYSGAELFTRPKLARDRADIRAGMFQALIVYAVDRLSRNTAHLEILSEECKRAGCRLIFITGEAAHPSDEVYAAEVERRKTIERTSRGRRTKLMQGRPVFNGWDLYGYRADHQGGVYLIYEPEAAVVRRIFSWYATGRGMHSIASTLNREGLPSPKSDRRPGAKWTSSTISRLLNTRSYMGEEYGLKTKRDPRGRDLPRPESEWVRLPEGVRPSIISRELWGICQRMIRARAEQMKRNSSEPRAALLRGHIFCGECGARMIRNHFKRGKYEYEKYRCGSRWRPFKTDCRGEGVTLSAINEWAWERVKSLLLDPRKIARALNEMERTGIDDQLVNDLEAAKRALERSERALQALTRSHASASDLNLRSYMAREVGRATREKQQLERTIAEIEARIKETQRRVTDLRHLVNRCALTNGCLNLFTFEDQGLVLRALGVIVRANGDDPARWHYALDIPIYEP